MNPIIFSKEFTDLKYGLIENLVLNKIIRLQLPGTKESSCVQPYFAQKQHGAPCIGKFPAFSRKSK